MNLRHRLLSKPKIETKKEDKATSEKESNTQTNNKARAASILNFLAPSNNHSNNKREDIDETIQRWMHMPM